MLCRFYIIYSSRRGKGISKVHATARAMLDHAISHLDDGGEQAVKVEEICAYCGVSITSLYHHFGNREGLIVAAQAERFVSAAYGNQSELLTDLERLDGPSGVVDVLKCQLRSVSGPALAQVRRMRLQVLASAASRPELAERIRASHAEQLVGLTERWRQLQERGIVSQKHSAGQIAGLVSGLVFGRVHDEVLDMASETAGLHESILMAGVLAVLVPD